MEGIFGDIGFLALKKGLEVGSLRHKVISQNIANITTPKYVAKEVKFEEILREKMGFRIRGVRTHPNHLPVGKLSLEEVEPVVVESTAGIPAGGLNNVNLDREMVELAKNSLKWDVVSRLLSGKYRTLRASISGRY